MNEEELNELEDKFTLKEIKSQRIESHAQRILMLQNEIPKPKGLLRKKCPKCDKILTSNYIHTNPFRYIILYECKCGYEYAVARKTNMR